MSSKENIYILDSFAVLAYLGDEPGRKQVQTVLEQAEIGQCRVVFSLINLGEAVYIVERERGLGKAQEALGVIDQLPIEILPVTRQGVLTAAHIKANFPLAYADAFVVAAALELGGVILTGDPEFDQLGDLVQVERLAR